MINPSQWVRHRVFKIVLGLVACLLLLPLAAGLWISRGDPDIRLGQHRAYLESVETTQAGTPPNIVLILADDLGYGDIGSFGARAIRTPNLDALASEGVRLTAFYSGSPVCSPSRFSYLTGRYATRGFIHAVFFPSGTLMGLLVNSLGFPRGVRGIPPDEVTIAEALQAGGYATGMFGKWHLGDRQPHLPTDKGFDYFFGSFYSNDMEPYAYYRNGDVAIEAPADQSKLTQQLTSEILDFIAHHGSRPFFIYYASPFPHHPVHSGEDFAGRSPAGPYGDCVEELDWSVGEIRRKLADTGLSENTLVVFTSDNGPWYEGASGPYRGRKGNNFDGGQLVPFVASWPGRIPAGTEALAPAMSVDLLPTFLGIAGIATPKDRAIDGSDITPLLTGAAQAPLDRELYFVDGGQFVGVRTPEDLKQLSRHRSENTAYRFVRQGPFLFDLSRDPGESYDLSASKPKESARLAEMVQEMNRANDANPRGWAVPR